jgi:putative thioredoxin
VKAFRNGQVVSEFVGAQPEPRVREFLRAILPSEADQLAARGAAAEGRQDLIGAAAAYQQALEKQPDQPLALLGLGRVALAEGRYDEAIEFFSQVPPASPQGEDARQLIVQTRVRAESAALGQEDDLLSAQAAAAADSPAWLDAQIALGKLRIAQGQYAAGLELLLEAVRVDRTYQDGAARKAMVDVFALLGDQEPLTSTYRRRLSSILF